MDKPQIPSIGIEALLFLGLILVPYFAISFAMQLILFKMVKKHLAPSISELIVAHAMSFLVTIVMIMIFMHYAEYFEPLFIIIPLLNSYAQIFFYHKPYHTFKKISLIVLSSNIFAAMIDAFCIFYYFDWFIQTFFK
jgi:hypothetical protein